MIGNKKRIESLEQKLGLIFRRYGEDKHSWGEDDSGILNTLYKFVREQERKLQALEDYLNIEYKEESTKEYVKKEVDSGDMLSLQREMIKRIADSCGRKSNNKKK